MQYLTLINEQYYYSSFGSSIKTYSTSRPSITLRRVKSYFFLYLKHNYSSNQIIVCLITCLMPFSLVTLFPCNIYVNRSKSGNSSVFFNNAFPVPWEIMQIDKEPLGEENPKARTDNHNSESKSFMLSTRQSQAGQRVVQVHLTQLGENALLNLGMSFFVPIRHHLYPATFFTWFIL